MSEEDEALLLLDKEDEEELAMMRESAPLSAAERYGDKIRDKLGGEKSKFYGYLEEQSNKKKKTDQELSSSTTTIETKKPSNYVQFINPELFKDEEKNRVEDPSDEELVDIVAKKLEERNRERRQQEELRAKKMLEENLAKRKQKSTTTQNVQKLNQTTSGVGGSWVRNETALQETRRPSRSSWGCFERPKDISKAYGGGRRVGVGYTDEVDESRLEHTRMLHARYQERMGLNVQAEKEHADEIKEATQLSALAMKRGNYATAVSCLEKVSRYCHSNSKVGGQVLLELAMAYEANGDADAATQVYKKLSKSLVDSVRNNAKKLLYGMEALQLMRDAGQKSFELQEIQQTFVDATKMDTMSSHFDKVYGGAYLELKDDAYLRITEAMVRTPQEARQILFEQSTNRMRVVQALRYLSRCFDSALRAEGETKVEPVAFLDGKPIVRQKTTTTATPADGFVLRSAADMMEDLNGEWRLQLLADKSGDGVRFYNKTLSWQRVDTATMCFDCQGPAGFRVLSESGNLGFEQESRTLRRYCNQTQGFSFLSFLLPSEQAGAASNTIPQQILTIDSVLLVTRCSVDTLEKDHFAVWRRVEPGTFPSFE